jgi:molybdopterin converting factor small subunit
MPRLGALAVSLLLLAVPALAACGEDTDEQNDYVDEVNAVTMGLNDELSRIAEQVTSISNPGEAADAFANFSEEVDAAAAELEGIDPPEEVEELQAQLVTEVERLAAEAENIPNEIREGGAAAVIGVATGFIAEANRVGADIDSTLDEINSVLQD